MGMADAATGALDSLDLDSGGNENGENAVDAGEELPAGMSLVEHTLEQLLLMPGIVLPPVAARVRMCLAHQHLALCRHNGWLCLDRNPVTQGVVQIRNSRLCSVTAVCFVLDTTP